MQPLASYGAPLASDAVSGNTMQVTIDGSITITEVDNQALDLELSGGDISSGTPAVGQHLVRVALSVPGGYTLSMESDSASLLREGATTGVFDGTGDTTGGFGPIGGSVTSEADANVSYNVAVLIGLTFASRMTGDGSTAPATGAWGFNLNAGSSFTSVPTMQTIIAATNISSEAATNPTLITYGAQAGLTTPPGAYGAYITYVATTNAQALPPAPTAMQQFTDTQCSAMSIGDTISLQDARDGQSYQIRKMPDGKCWMLDNLAYVGGGTNTYGDVVASNGTGVGGLVQQTTTAGWADTTLTATNNRRQIMLNTQAGLGGTMNCSDSAPSGSGVMESTCGGQIMYNFCAALGLDSGTTPSCATVSNTTTGAGMAATGIVGATGGQGGESLGSGGSSICPAGWRIPVGLVGSAPGALPNDWNALNVAIGGANITTATNDTGPGQGFWQPSGTTSSFPAMFGAVSAGGVNTTGNLANQSTNASWWSSSLNSASFGRNTGVNSTGVYPGTFNNNKANGLTVRCVAN
ncbi:fibrobacter succinogenes major paralogous domain-containing protein [Candidatus Saccharibacteria bacterium]|nr:fibrobacter succinogenes major paralogous domain-containing protein [Candidatus Saccharibacteria bacterium]